MSIAAAADTSAMFDSSGKRVRAEGSGHSLTKSLRRLPSMSSFIDRPLFPSSAIPSSAAFDCGVTRYRRVRRLST